MVVSCLRMFSLALDNICTTSALTTRLGFDRRIAARDALLLLGPCLCPNAPQTAQDAARAAHECLGVQTLTGEPSREEVLADWKLSSLATLAREACGSLCGNESAGQREPHTWEGQGPGPSAPTATLPQTRQPELRAQPQAMCLQANGRRRLLSAAPILFVLLFVTLVTLATTAPVLPPATSSLRSSTGLPQQGHVAASTIPWSLPRMDRPQQHGVAEKAAPTTPGQHGNRTARHLRWFGAMQGGSGYGVEATETVAALVAAGLDVSAQTIDEGEYYYNFPTTTAERVVTALRVSPPPGFVAVCHMSANLFGRRGCPPPGAGYVVGRTMWEYSSVPDNHLLPMVEVDEIWVPSIFVKQLYIASGLPAESIVVIPEPTDVEVYDPSVVQPLGKRPPWKTYGVDVTTSPAPFRFFSMFNSESAKRKGVAETVSAFINEFTMADNVELYLPGSFGGIIGNMLRLAENVDPALSFNETMQRMARIRPYGFVPQIDMPSFYKTMDCLVLPTEGEGWGRPVSDSMAMALPVIVTGWSGESEYVRPDNAFLLEYTLVDSNDHPVTPGQRIRAAKPTVASVQQAMREVVAHPETAKAKGLRARELISKSYSGPAVAELVRRHLERISFELSSGNMQAGIRQEAYRGADWTGIDRSKDFVDAVKAKAYRSVSFNKRT